MNGQKKETVVEDVLRFVAKIVGIQILISWLAWLYMGIARFSFFDVDAVKFSVLEIIASIALAVIFLYLVWRQKRTVFAYGVLSAMWFLIGFTMIRVGFNVIPGTKDDNSLMLILLTISFLFEWMVVLYSNWLTLRRIMKNPQSIFPLDKQNGKWNMKKPIIKPNLSDSKDKDRFWKVARLLIPLGSVLGSMIYRMQNHIASDLVISVMILLLAYLFVAISAILASDACLVLRIEKGISAQLYSCWK